MSNLTGRATYTVPEICMLTGRGRDFIYRAIQTGELVARKMGNRIVVTHDDFSKYLHSLPRAVTPQPLEAA